MTTSSYMPSKNFTLFGGSCGLTLIELLLTIAIISVIAFASASFYGRFLTQNAVANTQDQLVSSFRKAQLYSMMGKQSDNWGVTINASKIILYKGASFTQGGRSTAFDESFSVNPTITISGMSDVNFARITGIPTDNGSPITTLTITISGNTSSKTISLNSQGVASKTN